MKRAGFTLIELLIVTAVIGTMLAGAVLSVAAGRQSARMRTATQRAQQLARHARTVALLKRCPAVVTFEEVYGGDGTFTGSKVTIEARADDTAARARAGQVQTLSGETVGAAADGGDGLDGENAGGADDPMTLLVDDPEETEDERKGRTARRQHSFAGIHLKAELLDEDGGDGNKNRISVFSNVEYLRNQAKASRSETLRTKDGDDGEDGDAAAMIAEASEPVSVAYEPNGNCAPYRITVWKDGANEQDGLVVNVDKFGKVKVEDGK